MNLQDYVINQLKNMFMLSDDEERQIVDSGVIEEANQLTIRSLSKWNSKYFNGLVNPVNSVMYCQFLYWMSHITAESKMGGVPDKVYYLNKALNCVDLFYAIDLPLDWNCEHPLGSVMGRAKYGEHFFFYQGCTVGGSYHKGELYYPIIGNNVLMYSNSKVLGNCHVGDNVIFSANSYIINQDIPSDSIVFGQGKSIVIKKRN